MPPAGYAAVVIVVLGLSVWGMYQRGNALALQAQQSAQERDQALTALDDLKAANARVIAADAARMAELETLRREHAQRVRRLSLVPDDGCLDRPVPAALDDGLRDEADDASAAAPDARASPGPAVDGAHVP